MAGGVFQIDTNAVNKSGSKFQDLSVEYKTLMNNLRSTVEDLGVVWKSDDYNQFLTIYKENAETIEQMSKAFASFGDVLKTTASTAVKKSEELRSSFK